MKREPYRYRAFGLVLAAERPIAGLQAALESASVDVVVHFGRRPPDTSSDLDAAEPFFRSGASGGTLKPFVSVWRIEGTADLRLLMGDGAEFFIRSHGTEVWVSAPQIRDEVVDEHLVGPVFASILRVRGIVCLHASAVAVDGNGVAFVGGEGAGKSTLAVLLAMRGHCVITDDLAAIVDSGTSLLIQPGAGYLRARPGVVESVAADRSELEPRQNGLYLDLPLGSGRYGLAAAPTRLEAVYCLEWSDRATVVARIEEISASDALVSLLANTWASRLLNSTERAAELDVLSRLVDRTVVRRLILGASVDTAALIRSVEADVVVGARPSHA